MSSSSKTSDSGDRGAGGTAWADAQRRVRERNDAARRHAKQEREESDRRATTERLRRYARDGVYR